MSLENQLPRGRFEGQTEFAELIRLAFVAAAAQGWREIIICDSTFEDWPLGERAVAQSLHEWASSGRKLTMLAKSYNEVMRRHARIVSWRRNWSHMIECRTNTVISQDDMPSAQLFIVSLIRAIIESWTKELVSFCLIKKSLTNR